MFSEEALSFSIDARNPRALMFLYFVPGDVPRSLLCHELNDRSKPDMLALGLHWLGAELRPQHQNFPIDSKTF